MVLRDNRSNNFYARLFSGEFTANTPIGETRDVVLDINKWTYSNGVVVFPRIYVAGQANVNFSIVIQKIEEAQIMTGPFTIIPQDRLIGTFSDTLDTFNTADNVDYKIYTVVGIGLLNLNLTYLKITLEFKGPVSNDFIIYGCDGVFYPEVYPFNTAVEQAKINDIAPPEVKQNAAT